MPDLDRKLAGIYLNDHLALATGAAELAKRAHASNPDGPLGELLGRFEEELAGDREALIDVIARLGLRRDRAKELGGWTFEKAGRLKLNGRLTSYSPLSRVTELDGLTLLNGAMRSLWRGIGAALADDPRLDGVDTAMRVKLADARSAALDEHRDAAVVTALRGAA